MPFCYIPRPGKLFFPATPGIFQGDIETIRTNYHKRSLHIRLSGPRPHFINEQHMGRRDVTPNLIQPNLNQEIVTLIQLQL